MLPSYTPLDSELKVLAPQKWEEYIPMFTECGMEVYETSAAVWAELQGTSRNCGSSGSLHRLRTSVEQLHQQLYATHEVVDQLNLKEDTQCGGGSMDGSCRDNIE